MNRRTRVAAISALAVFALSGLALAGPLNPPAGAVTNTGKTLTEVEPRTAINATNTPGDATSLYVIQSPGSYYLTENLYGAAGKHGIKIAASNVTIDLNGFRMQGGTGNTSGITVASMYLNDITVENGSLTAWLGSGVDLVTNFPARSTVRNVRCDNIVGSGIRVYNDSSVIDCTSDGNGTYGFDAYSNCTFVRCQASHNVGHGFDTSSQCTLSHCGAVENAGIGVHTGSGCLVEGDRALGNGNGGISVGPGSLVSGCVAQLNVAFGIDVSGGCLVVQNACSNTTAGVGGAGGGIHVTNTDNRIEGNTCTGNVRGFDVQSPGNLIIRNSCSGSALSWVIVAGNAYGPIVATPAGAAVNGSTAASALGSTDPNANFTY